MSRVAATLYEGSRVDRSRYGSFDHRERQSRCALRSDDTDAVSHEFGYFGRSDRSAQFAVTYHQRTVVTIDRWFQSVCHSKANTAGVQAADTTRFCRAPNLITICDAIPPPSISKVAQYAPNPDRLSLPLTVSRLDDLHEGL
jgi:hypothetical protein